MHLVLYYSVDYLVKWSRVLSDCIFLFAFLIMHYPDIVPGEKWGADFCSNMLEKVSITLTHQLQCFVDSVAYSEEIDIKSISFIKRSGI